MAIVQCFATVSELLEINDLRGTKREAELFDKLRAASRLLEMRVGRFLPVTETRKLAAPRLSTRLFLPFPLLSISSIVNDGKTLTTADYITQPNGAHWSNGPYSYLEIDPDATNLSAWDTEANGVEMVCDTGLYAESETTGASLATALNNTTGTALHVSNGGKVSPGMVLKVDSERVFVKETAAPVTNITTLSANLDANAETCTFADGSLINPGEIIRRGFEQMKVLELNGNSGYLQRGWNKTLKTAHASGGAVDVYRNFVIERGVNGSTAATHLVNAALTRDVPPADVNELARKIAVRMLKDAATGYAGRSGDETLGQATYTYILPHELDEVMNRYDIPQVG